MLELAAGGVKQMCVVGSRVVGSTGACRPVFINHYSRFTILEVYKKAIARIII
jgi:hypothetical protein